MSEITSESVVIDATPGAPSELDSAVADFITQTETEYRAEDAASESKPSVPAVTDDNSQAAQAEAPAVSDAATPKPDVDTATAVVEALAKAREQARVEKDARRAQRKADKAQRKALKPPKDEIAAIKRMGLDPDLVVRKVIAERLGDKAPPELRATIENANRDRQIRALEEKVIAQSREIAAKQYFDTVSSGAKSYLGTGEYSKNAPTVAEVAKRDPDRVHAEVMQEIISDANARMHREPNGQVMTYDAAVARVEKRWSEFRKLFTPSDSPTSGQASTQNTSPTQVQEKKSTPKTIRPPDRPLAPWLQRTATEEDGIRAALDEFNRVENSKIQK